jgi:hypothetical protein
MRNRKCILTLLLVLTASLQIFGQAPQSFNYQAVCRDNLGNIIAGQTVNLRFTIYDITPGGTILYQENHTTTTNSFGLVNLAVGTGSWIAGNFLTIPWGSGAKYLGVELNAGSGYNSVGTPQLLSVPYAIYANSSGNGIGTTGPTGATGQQGTTGAQGITGPVGQQGTTGAQGITGPTGLQGITGAQGITGPTGQSGVDGVTGPQGTTGNDGAIGMTGPQGVTGATGPAGTNAGVGGFVHYPGEYVGDGVIFYVYKGLDGNEHGLVVDLHESTLLAWQTTTSLVNANRTDDGAYNTALMTNSPAKTYVTSLGAGWYLPSIDELILLFDNRFATQKGMRAVGYTPISDNDVYWSSYENGATLAWGFNFGYGYTFTTGKTNQKSVRAIRAF